MLLHFVGLPSAVIYRVPEKRGEGGYAYPGFPRARGGFSGTRPDSERRSEAARCVGSAVGVLRKRPPGTRKFRVVSSSISKGNALPSRRIRALFHRISVPFESVLPPALVPFNRILSLRDVAHRPRDRGSRSRRRLPPVPRPRSPHGPVPQASSPQPTIPVRASHRYRVTRVIPSQGGQRRSRRKPRSGSGPRLP